MSDIREGVKGFFETNDYPTQAQFYQWLNGTWFKDEQIPVTNIEGLVDILNTLPRPKQVVELSAPGSVIIPQQCEVYKITFKSNVPSQTISYGITSTGDDIENGILVTAGVIARAVNDFEVAAGGSIHFDGIIGLTTITIYKD